MYDLTVIGGGPAGTSAAITARAAGVNVLLLERVSFPRHKVCGEFVSAESLGLLDTLLCDHHKLLLRDAIRIDRTRIFLDGRVIETSVNPSAASIARLDLDPALWESAERSGVEARQRVTVQKISGSSPFSIQTSDSEFQSRSVINASGRWSNLTADASVNSREKWLGVKGHFSEPPGCRSVDLYFFEGGYCGVQPVSISSAPDGENRINACAMVRADVASTLPEVFERHPQLKARSRTWKPLSDPVSTSPLIFRDPQPERDGILNVGDAALFVDPFIGDGISLALRSGALAAQCLSRFFEEEISLQEAVLDYRKTYREKLTPVFTASSVIRNVLKFPRVIRKPMTALVKATPMLAKYLVKRTR